MADGTRLVADSWGSLSLGGAVTKSAGYLQMVDAACRHDFTGRACRRIKELRGGVCGLMPREDNPFFMPETGSAGNAHAWNMFRAIADYNSLAISSSE